MRAILLIVALSVCGGCCSSEVAKSTALLSRDFGLYRRAVVPNPSMDDDQATATKRLGDAISSHLAKLEELTGE